MRFVCTRKEEIIKIILAARPGDEKDLILCILHTLGRIDEILRLKWADVNFDRKIVTLYTRKRKGGSYEADDLPMSQDLTDLLMRRWRARKQDAWVFWNEIYKNRYIHMQKTMPRICKRAEIAPIGKGSRKINGEKVEVDLYYGFHSLRHFMASYHHDTLKTGTSAVSKLLRHKSFRTTEVYLHSIDESVRAAVARQDGIFTPENANPQALPASISEKANDFS